MQIQNTANALISAEEIAESILLKRGMSQHYWWRILPLVCEAVQELAFTSMPLVKHTQLEKLPGETWFRLPNGFQDWVSVGIRQGNRWIPVGVSERLMPYPNSECAGGQFDNEFNASEFRRNGDWKSWLNRSCKWGNADFFTDDFLNTDFSDTETVTEQPQPIDPYAYNGLGWGLNGGLGWGYGYMWPYAFGSNDIGEPVQGRFSPFIRPDEVTFNVERGIIMVPDAFPSNLLYLVYVGIGSADTLTHIPITAQAVIEAYVYWKYALNTPDKKGSLNVAGELQRQYDYQHRLYRARGNDLTETTIRRIVDRGYIRDSWGYGDNGIGGACDSTSTTVIYYTNQTFTVYSGTGGVTYVQSQEIIGKNIVYVIVGDVYKTTGFYVQGDMLIFNDGTEFYDPTKVVIYYEN